MPFLEDSPTIDLSRRVDVPKGFTVTPGAVDVEDTGAKPAWNWGAAFRRNNELFAMASSESLLTMNEPEAGFNPWEQIKGTPDEANFELLSVARNQQKFDAIKRDIASENEDRKVLDSQPWWMGLLTEGPASILSPTTLLPGGTFVKGAKGGIALVRSAASVGAAAAAGTAVQEAMLQGIEQTRTALETTTAIGSSVIVGGVLGAAGAALLSRGEYQKAVAALDADLAKGPMPDKELDVLAAANENRTFASVGAAANTATDLADNSIAGRAASATAAATARLNPLLRALHSPSAVFRDVMLQTVENPLYLTKNMEGVASEPAAETLMKEYQGKLAQALRSSNEAYPEYVKGGGQLSKGEFNEAVGKAMRRDDTDADPVISKVASEWRSKVFDPLKDRAIEMGLLPKDVSVSTASSYFTRMWNGRAISADEQGFKGMVVEHVEQRLRDEFATSVQAHAKRLARIEQEAADLQLTPEQRLIAAQDVQARLDALEARTDLTDQADQISELRQKSITARRSGDENALTLLKDQSNGLTKAGGDNLKTFLAERAELRARRRNIEFGVSGLEARHDRILGQLDDLEESNFREMERLIRKGQKLERDLNRLDADAYEAKIDQLADSYASIARKAEASAARATKNIENIKAAAERGTEKNRMSAERAATEASVGPPEEAAAKRTAAKEFADKNVAKRAARDAAVEKRLKTEAERQTALAERMDKIAERLQVAKSFDHDGLMEEVRSAIQKATREASARSMARGQRAARLAERLDDVNPSRAVDRAKMLGQMRQDLENKFVERWEVGRGALDVNPASGKAQFNEVAKQVANEVFDILTGRTGDGIRPEFITVKARGPMKERTFNIPDLFTAANGRAVENYLEHDVEAVARRYTRVMGADIELTRKFGSVDMVEQIAKIREDYANLRAGVTDEKQLLKLGKREADDIRDLEAIRDMLRGTDPGAASDANYSRVVRSVNHFNYLRSMGEVAIASLTETVRPAMVHGLLPYMETLGQTLGNMKGIRASVAEAQLAGNVTERVLGSRLATLSEITDPYTSRGPVESFLENLTNIASKWNGIRLLTDMQKSIASVMTQNRILRGSGLYKEVSDKERAYLAFVGIDESMAGRIAQQFAEHGETVEKVRVANTEKWTDDVARRTYRAAMNKDVDSIITTKGVADTPLFANTPTGKAMLQFKSFALASHQRVLLRGLQEDQSRFVGGLIAMTTIGMMATWLKAQSGNRDEKLVNAAEQPGWWISEGLDKSGILAIPMEIANAAEKATGFNPIKTPLKAFDEKGSISQKNQNKSLIGAIAGPTAGLIDDASNVAGLPQKLINGEDVTQGQKNAAERLLPFNSYLGIRQMLRYVVNPPAQ